MQISPFPLCVQSVVEHWHEDDPVRELCRFDVLFLQILLDLLENLQWRKSWENIPLEFSCFSINSYYIFVRKDTSWVRPLDLSILLLLLCFHSSVPHIERNLSGHALLLLPTWLLDHETIPISSMREMTFQAVSHSEFLQNVPISTSKWYWTNCQSPRSSCSCKPPGLPSNSAQDEWRLSSTRTWTFSMSTHLFFMLPSKKLSGLL